jgi:hypothetical protein
VRKFTVRRRKQLTEFNNNLMYPQPVRGQHECTACDEIFMSEAAFTFHRRVRGPRSGMICLTERQLKKAGFKRLKSSFWRAPGWTEWWYIDILEKGEATKEDWAA